MIVFSTGSYSMGIGVVGLVGPLAEIDRVRSPVEQPGAGVEVPIPPPLPGDVGMVVESPRGRSEPQVPIDHVARRGRLAGQPGRFDRGRVDRGVERVDLAQLAALREPDGGLEIRHAPPLGAGLEDAARSVVIVSSRAWQSPIVRPHGFSL